MILPRPARAGPDTRIRREPIWPGLRRADADRARIPARVQLDADGAWRRDRGRAVLMARAAGSSTFGHVAIVGLIIGIPALLRALMALGPPYVPPPPPRPPATIELIKMDTPSVGASKLSKAARATPTAAKTPTKPAGAPTPLTAASAPDAVPAQPGDANAVAPPSTSASAAPEAEEASIDSPEVNLDLDSDETPGVGIVEGDNVIPASPDAKHPNLPPEYPRAAVERGEEGTVGMIIDIAPDGHAQDVSLVSSSGYKTLDDAALKAVEKWHFRPSVSDGKPVPSIFNQQISFEINGRGDRP